MKIDPIMDLQASAEFEKRYFENTAADSLSVIRKVGKKIAKDFFKQTACKPKRIALLLGKGNNAADAVAFALSACKKFPKCKIDIALLFDESKLGANLRVLLGELKNAFGADFKNLQQMAKFGYSIVVEGIAAMRFSGAISPEFCGYVNAANSLQSDYKIAVDLPFGIGEKPASTAFVADYTYATGIAKKPLFCDFNAKYVGRIRYVDIGFFDGEKEKASQYIYNAKQSLSFFKKLRRSDTDKRSYGFLTIVGGSREYKGAVLLNAKGALKSGIGLLRVCVPEGLDIAFAVNEPSAMWTPCPVCENGFLALEGLKDIAKYAEKSTALLLGSGAGRTFETRALFIELIKNFNCPIVLDADAICPECLQACKDANRHVLICPHNGEFLRLAKDSSDQSLMQVAKQYNATVMLKGCFVRVCDGKNIVVNTEGTPALARASTGDMLAGIAASLVANKEYNLSLQESALAAYSILGKAANKAAKKCGENAIIASEILQYIKR